MNPLAETTNDTTEEITMTDNTTAGEYRIQAVGDIGIHAEDRWVAVLHEPCGEYVFGDGSEDPDDLDVAALLSLIAAHHCPGTGAGA